MLPNHFANNAIEELNWISLRNTKVGNDVGSILCLKDDWVGIDLSFTNVSSPGVNCFAEQKHLDQSGLQGTNIDDAGVEALANHPSLRILNLADTRITEQAIDSLASMPKLETLVVSGTGIGVDGVRRLAKVPHLKTLSIAWHRATMAKHRGGRGKNYMPVRSRPSSWNSVCISPTPTRRSADSGRNVFRRCRASTPDLGYSH